MRVLAYFRGHMLEDRGTPLRARNLLAALAARDGVVVSVLSRDDASRARASLPFSHRPILGATPPGGQLAAAVTEVAPDVVYGQTHNAMADLRRLGGRERPARVVDLHGDLAAERWERPGRSFGSRLAKFAKARLEEVPHYLSMDGFTVVSEPLAGRVRWTRRPVQVLWGGVDPTVFRPATVAEDGVLEIAYAGNFRPYQGVDGLVEATARLVGAGTDARLLLIGDHTPFPELAERYRERLGDRLELAGQLPYAEVPRRLAAADVLVIPRVSDRTARYGFPSKLPEYLALGRPVILTDVGDQARVVDHGESGWVVPPDSPQALEGALTALADGELRAKLGRGARRVAESRLSWERMARDLESFLRRVVGRRAQ